MWAEVISGVIISRAQSWFFRAALSGGDKYRRLLSGWLCCVTLCVRSTQISSEIGFFLNNRGHVLDAEGGG